MPIRSSLVTNASTSNSRISILTDNCARRPRKLSGGLYRSSLWESVAALQHAGAKRATRLPARLQSAIDRRAADLESLRNLRLHFAHPSIEAGRGRGGVFPFSI